jgi:hypothetical protein
MADDGTMVYTAPPTTWWQTMASILDVIVHPVNVAIVMAALATIITMVCMVVSPPAMSEEYVNVGTIALGAAGYGIQYPTDVPIAVPVATTPRSLDAPRAEAYVAFCDHDTSIITGVDTYAEISIIRSSRVNPAWEMIDGPPLPLDGIGGRVTVSKRVRVPMRQQWGAQMDYVEAFIGEPPRGLDFLMGLDIQDALGVTVSPRNHTVHFADRKLMVRTDPIKFVVDRVRANPLRVLATNSGCNFAYAAVRNLGFVVRSWVSIEKDPQCRLVTRSIVPQSALRDDITDVTQVGNKLDGEKFDLMIDTSPCQPWSRLRDNPKGFDEPEAKPFIAANALFKRVRNSNPHIQFIVENVEPKATLAYQKNRMEAMWGANFTTVNAKDWGSPSSRPRTYCTNICDVKDVTGTSTPDPNLFISDDYYCDGPHMPCIVASDYTRNVPVVKHRASHKPRRLTVAEAEALQMWPPHITDGFKSPLGISQTDRHKMVEGSEWSSHVRDSQTAAI